MARRSPPVQTFDLNANVAANYARPPMDNGEMAIAAGRAVAAIGNSLSKLAKAGEDAALAKAVEQASEQGARDAEAAVSMPKVTERGFTGDYYARLRQIESGGNDRAVNPNSSAKGRYQFINSTARQYGITDPFDVNQQEAAVRRFTDDNRRALVKALGREPTPGELYLAHQQGAGGAAKLLANPDADAASVVGADAVRLNGGRVGMTAGQFARLWTSKFEGGRSVVLPDIKPLQLRKDGTPQGEAYDTAQVKTGAYRAKVAMQTGLDALAEQFAEDPEGFEKEAAKLRQSYVGAFGNVPELQATADAEFELNAAPMRRQIYDRRDRKAEAEMKAAATEAVGAQGALLEKQAYGIGVNADGDQQLAAIQARAMTVIDSAAEIGAITPAEASRQRQAVTGRLVQARFDGVVDALKTPAEKLAFVEKLASPEMRDELLEKMPLEDYRTLVERYRMVARQSGEAQDAEARIEKRRFEKLIDDDLASLAATGTGVALGGLPLSADEVARVLGPEKAEAWSAARGRTLQLFAATDGLARLTPEQIEQRLAGVAPKAGAEGYADAEQMFGQAAKAADAILKKRAEDPAAAVDEAFGLLEDEALASDPAALAEARMDRQAALGIPELARQPLSNAEAKRLAARLMLYRDEPEAQAQLVERMAAEMQDAYGPNGEAAMAQVLRQNGVSRDMSALMVQAAAKTRKGEPLTRSDARAMDQALRRDMANDAMAGTSAPVAEAVGGMTPPAAAAPAPFAARGMSPRQRHAAGTPKPQKAPTVNATAVEFLRANPELAPEFDRKYGAGLAESYLAAPAQDFRARTLPDGSRELVYENGWVEIMKPDGSVEGRMQ
jgi:hypothetical protein